MTIIWLTNKFYAFLTTNSISNLFILKWLIENASAGLLSISYPWAMGDLELVEYEVLNRQILENINKMKIACFYLDDMLKEN